MHIPMNCKGWVTGNRGAISPVDSTEDEIRFFLGEWFPLKFNFAAEERLIIFSHDQGSKTSNNGRMAAERLVNELVQDSSYLRSLSSVKGYSPCAKDK
eukprot:5786131-Amphidinium_carterae.1